MAAASFRARHRAWLARQKSFGRPQFKDAETAGACKGKAFSYSGATGSAAKLNNYDETMFQRRGKSLVKQSGNINSVVVKKISFE